MLYIGLQIRRQGPDVRVQEQDQGQDQTDDRDQNTGQDIMLYTGRCTDQDADRGTGPDTDDRTIA